MVGNKKYIYRSNDYFRGLRIIEPCTYMKEYTRTEFEGEMLMISSNYDEILTDAYGDYMKPVRDRAVENRHDKEAKRDLYRSIYYRR